MNKNILVLVTSCFLSFSCNTQRDKKSTIDKPDTSKKQIILPYLEDSIGKKDRQQLPKNVARSLRLSSIDTTCNGLRVRIWIWENVHKYMVELSNESGNYKADLIEISGLNKDNKEYIILHDTRSLQPKSSWTFLFNAIEKYNILDLESGTIQNQRTESLTTMSYVQFEICKDGKYRFYEYLEPSYYRYVDKNSNQIYEFLKLLNKEMGIRVYGVSEKLFIDPNEKKLKH